MQIPKKDAETDIVYLRRGDFGIKIESDLYIFKDFLRGVTTNESQVQLNRMISNKVIKENYYVSKSRINNLKKKLYNIVKKLKIPGKISFAEYCNLHEMPIEKLDRRSYSTYKPHYLRGYLREVLDLRGTIEILWKR